MAYAWARVGEAVPIAGSRLAALAESLSELAPAEDEQACSAELGLRWMLVFSNGVDLTGVVVDDFGCEDIRLTDEPFTTVPGDATQPGTVPGVLAGSLLDDLKAAHGGPISPIYG